MQTHKTSIQNAPEPDMDTLQASLFYLMTQYTQHSDVRIAQAVVDQMAYLLNHSLIELLPAQRETLAKLLNIWRGELIRCPDCGESMGSDAVRNH